MAPENPQPEPFDLSQGPWAEKILQIEDQLKEDCWHINEMIHEADILREFITRQFLDESEKMILARRRQYQPLLAQLLERGLDITGIGRQLTELECLIKAYQELKHSRYPHASN